MSASIVMSTSMTGYDTSATVYPTPQYGYEGENELAGLHSAVLTASLCPGDPRQAGWGGVQYQPAHHQQLPGQGSPSERYSYYDNR